MCARERFITVHSINVVFQVGLPARAVHCLASEVRVFCVLRDKTRRRQILYEKSSLLLRPTSSLLSDSRVLTTRLSCTFCGMIRYCDFITVLRNNRKIDTEEYRMYRNTLMIWRFLQFSAGLPISISLSLSRSTDYATIGNKA